MTLEHKKIGIIKKIASSNEEALIHAIEEVLQKFSDANFKLNLAKHPNISNQVDLEYIKKERPLIDFNMDEFSKEANELEWDKSINELLLELD